MILLLLTALVAGGCLGWSIYVARTERESSYVLIGLFGAIVAAVVGSIVILIVGVCVPHHFPTRHIGLAALQDGTTTQGTFYLGYGAVDGTPTYSLKNEDASHVVVYQDTDKPYLVQQTACRTSVEWLVHCSSDQRVTEIHVPAGTIKSNFVLDAK
jgi:hypothetical protein